MAKTSKATKQTLLSFPVIEAAVKPAFHNSFRKRTYPLLLCILSITG